MPSINFTFNNKNISITGTSEELQPIVRELLSSQNGNSSNLQQKTERQILAPLNNLQPKTSPTQEDFLKIYEHLAATGDFTIKQYTITRTINNIDSEYQVCYIFDKTGDRFLGYNPSKKDRSNNQEFTPQQAIDGIRNGHKGFSIVHKVANKLLLQMSLSNGLSEIARRPDEDNVEFKDYSPTANQRFSIPKLSSTVAAKEFYSKWFSDNVNVGEFRTSSQLLELAKVSDSVFQNTLQHLVRDGVLNHNKKHGKIWTRLK